MCKLNIQLPLEKFVDDYAMELETRQPKAVVRKGKQVFVDLNAVNVLAHCLFSHVRKRGIFFLN